MHNLVNIKLLDAKLLVYAKDTHGFTNYHTDYRRHKPLKCYFGQKQPLVKSVQTFKLVQSTCNKATLKSFFVLNSTAGRRRQAESTRPDFGSTYWGRLPGLCGRNNWDTNSYSVISANRMHNTHQYLLAYSIYSYRLSAQCLQINETRRCNCYTVTSNAESLQFALSVVKCSFQYWLWQITASLLLMYSL